MHPVAQKRNPDFLFWKRVCAKGMLKNHDFTDVIEPQFCYFNGGGSGEGTLPYIMRILILTDTLSHTLSLFSSTLASAVPFPASVQVIPASDVTRDEWEWAEWVILGLTCTADKPGYGLNRFLRKLPNSSLARKGLAIFQVQSRTDAPLTAAFGFALARCLRRRGMHLMAHPMVFFRERDTRNELEGELLRATQWLGMLAKQQTLTSRKDTR